jgi:hypothetical protein
VPAGRFFGNLAGWTSSRGYAEWLNAILARSLTRFYENLRWPGWEAEVAALALDEGITAYPPPFTVEDRDLSSVLRTTALLAELVSFYHNARQLGHADDA